MDKFMEEFLKIKTKFFKLIFLLFALDLVFFFAIFYSIFFILNIEYFLSLYFGWIAHLDIVLSLILTIILSLVIYRKNCMQDIITIIEKKYPILNEKLHTAYDNNTESNIIIDNLKNNITDILKTVDPSSLIEKGKVPIKISLILILLTTTLLTQIANISMTDFQIDHYLHPSQDHKDDNKDTNKDNCPPNIVCASINGKGDILGKPKIASISGKDIDITIHSGIDDIGNNVKNYNNHGQEQFNSSYLFPVDILGTNVSDYNAIMKKPETDKELIKKYATEIMSK